MPGSCVSLHKDVSSGAAGHWPSFLHRRPLRKISITTPALVDQSAGHIRQRASPRLSPERINLLNLHAAGILHRRRVAVGPGRGPSCRHALRAFPAGRRAVRPQSSGDGNSCTAETHRTQSRNADVHGRLILKRPQRYGIWNRERSISEYSAHKDTCLSICVYWRFGLQCHHRRGSMLHN
jgi:hypothetical protein